VFATLCFLVVVRAHHASDKVMLLCGLNKVFLPVLCYFGRVMPAHLRIMFISTPIVCTCNFFLMFKSFNENTITERVFYG
jgi:hypothetical protein